MQPRELTISQARALLEQGTLSAVELVTSVLDRIAAFNETSNAYLTVRPEAELLAEARRSDETRKKGGAVGSLHGLPVALKDNFETAGIRTTVGSRIFADWVPDRDAFVVSKLRHAGAIIVGKLNMHEFADGPTNENPHFGKALNPWNPSRTPGGSSGGSAVALATDMCLAAMGTDTGGSVRTPAAFCGVVGLKPTYGLVGRTGIFPFCWSFDHAGPMGRTTEDVASVLQAIVGHDPSDPASVTGCPPVLPTECDAAANVVIGVETTYLTALMEEDVRECFDGALSLLSDIGARVEAVRIPRLEVSLNAWLAINFPEAASVHRRYLDERPMDYGADVRRSLLSGRLFRADDYVEAQRVRSVLRRDMEAAFRQVDALVMPTVIIAPPEWGRETFQVEGQRLDTLNAFIRCTAPFNLLGNPALSIPCGLTPEGLPVGLQLVGRPFAESQLLQLGRAFEDARGPFAKPKLEI